MKKLYLWMLVSMFMLDNVCQARVQRDSTGSEKENSEEKEAKKQEREERKEEQRREKEAKKLQKEYEKQLAKNHKLNKPKKEKSVKPKKEKKEKVVKEKNIKVKKQKPEKQKKVKVEKKKHVEKHESKKSKKPAKVREQKKHDPKKEERDERRRAAKEAKEHKHSQKAQKRQTKEHEKKSKKIDRADAKKEETERKMHLIAEQDREEIRRKHEDVRHARNERRELIEQWKHTKKLAHEHKLSSGGYADLYISPAVPQHALWYEGKNFLNISSSYNYASSAYGSSGSSSNRNVTSLALGESPITFDEILLVSKLVSQKKLAYNANALGLQDFNGSLNFNGREEKYLLNLGIGRYVMNDDVAFGIDIPVGYDKRRIRNSAVNINAANGLNRDLSSIEPVLRNVLAAKGIYEQGGSTAGIGDISLYGNYQINSARWDKLVVGIKGLFPTANKASSEKLWGPELGNGGFFELSSYASMVMSYQKCINPHVMLELGVSMPAHVDRRVPQKVAGVLNIAAVNAAGGHPDVAELIVANASIKASDYIMNERVGPINFAGNALATTVAGDGIKAINIPAFSLYDTTIKGFGDKVSRFTLTKGPELKFRIGNSIERFITQRGFFDLFYDFRVKGRDHASGLSRDIYDVAKVENDTLELEHRIGAEFSHQHDLYTRSHLGVRYTFAGIHVPKTFEITGSLNHSF